LPELDPTVFGQCREEFREHDLVVAGRISDPFVNQGEDGPDVPSRHRL
jgi:hypothetical protein